MTTTTTKQASEAMKYLKKSGFTLLGADCCLSAFLKSEAGVWECYRKENTQGGSNPYHFTSPPEFVPLFLSNYWVVFVAYYILNSTL